MGDSDRENDARRHFREAHDKGTRQASNTAITSSHPSTTTESSCTGGCQRWSSARIADSALAHGAYRTVVTGCGSSSYARVPTRDPLPNDVGREPRAGREPQGGLGTFVSRRLILHF